MDESIIPRFVEMFPLDTQRFWVQRDTGQWSKSKREAVHALAARHLDRATPYWIGSAAYYTQKTPMTRFLLLDLDVREERTGPWRNARRIIELIDPQIAEPLIFSSPGGGYHVVYWFDTEISVFDIVDPKRSQSGGLLHEIARSIFGESGPGKLEVYPQPKACIRWPLGHRQFLVDSTTGRTRPENRIEALIDLVEHHFDAAPRLTLDRLREVAAEVIPKRAPATESGDSTVYVADKAGGAAIGEHTIRHVRRLFEHGLEKSSSRNRAMFEIACVMVHAPYELVDLGYAPDQDPAVKLLEWLQSKHNGFSAEYTANQDPAFWMRRSMQYVASARRSHNPALKQGSCPLRVGDWDRIERLADGATVGRPRHRVEIVAAGYLWKAASVVRRNGPAPDAVGHYTAEICLKWRRQLPFCKGKYEKTYRQILCDLALFRIEPGLGSTTRFSGLSLDLFGRPLACSLEDEELRCLSQLVWHDRLILHYCDRVLWRFPGDELERRYGSNGAQWIRRMFEELRGRVRADASGRSAHNLR